MRYSRATWPVVMASVVMASVVMASVVMASVVTAVSQHENGDLAGQPTP